MSMDYSKYPANWKEISYSVRFERAEGRCEWVENGERCEARHLELNPITGNKVILTTAHLDHDTTNNDPANLKALCNYHHLRYDRFLHAKNAAATRRRKCIEAGQLELI